MNNIFARVLFPVFPLVVAAIFTVFGIQTSAAAIATMVFNSVCGALTGLFVYEIGKLVCSEKAGFFAGLMWAFSPYLAVLPCLLWDTSLSALSLSAALWLTLKLQSEKAAPWIGCGALWGFVGLVNPALVAPFPLIALSRIRTSKWKHLIVTGATALLVVTPWTIRNYRAFHRLIPIRSNGLTELYFTNVSFATHPLGPTMEYQRLGEPAFTEQTSRLAIAYVRDHPRAFILRSLRRSLLFWIYPSNSWLLVVLIDIAALVGILMLFRNSWIVAAALLSVLALYPLTYYVTLVFSRFRHPIEPVLYVLAGITLTTISPERAAGQTVQQTLERK